MRSAPAVLPDRSRTSLKQFLLQDYVTENKIPKLEAQCIQKIYEWERTEDLQELINLIEEVKKKYKKQPVNTADGVKIEFDKEWVHLRKSNTEPIIRVYSEGTSPEKAKDLAEGVKKKVRS